MVATKKSERRKRGVEMGTKRHLILKRGKEKEKGINYKGEERLEDLNRKARKEEKAEVWHFSCA